MIAASAYLFDSFTQLIHPGLGTVSQLTAAAELLLPSWLLIKGVSADRWHEAAAA